MLQRSLTIWDINRQRTKGGKPNSKMGDIETVLDNELITVGPSLHLFGAHDLCRLQIEMWGDQAEEGENMVKGASFCVACPSPTRRMRILPVPLLGPAFNQ
jgi:hypothetical protein